MRVINVSESSALKYIRAVVLGTPKSGKTHFAASAPKPLFIADAAEGGYATIQCMDPALWWDPKSPPTVWAIEDAFADVPPSLAKLEALKAAGTFPYETIIVDPISIYADRVLAELQMRASGDKKAVDNRGLYGDLANHLRVLVLRFHALPCNVLWLCHVKDGGLALAGQTAEKLPAFMDFTWMCVNGGVDGYVLHTRPYGAYSILGGRITIRDTNGTPWGLPSPMIPSFKAIAQIFGLGVPISPAMPGHPMGAKYDWPPTPSKNGG